MIAPGPRAEDDDEIAAAFFGTGTLHQLTEPEADDPPGIWLPMHRSGSRFGGWRRRPVDPPPRVIGFRRP